jgi:hypothetical protein
MASSYHNARLPHSSRDRFVESPSLLRILAGLPSELYVEMQRLWHGTSNSYASVSTSGNGYKGLKSWKKLKERNWNPRQLLCLPHFFVALWLVLLLWGERWVFQDSIKACQWDIWEKWVGLLVPVKWGGKADESIAQRSNATSPNPTRRPSTHRSTYLPRPPMATRSIHLFTHR